MKVNDKLIAKAVECYVEKLEKENEILKNCMEQISDAFSFKGDNKDRNDKDILNDIMYTLRYYNEVFKADDEDGNNSN